MHKKLPHLAHPKYRPDIDGLRAVAILAVIIFHAFPDIIPGGFIGVDIFFVISGFLISTIIFSSLERDRFSIVEFYIRRIRRIFPALIVVLAACLILGWFVLFSDEYQQLGTHTSAGAGFVQNFILWRESGYFDNAADSKPLLHLWSLAIEEQFYIFWPLLLAFVWKRHWSFLKITAVIAAISFAANIYLMSRDATAAFYLPISRFWELMVGGVLAYVLLHRPHLLAKHKNAQSIFGFLLLLLGLLLLDKSRDFPGWWALLPTFGAFFIISAGGGWLNEKLLASKLMVWTGLISYPLYLWHWPLLAYLKIVEGEASRLERIGALGIAVVLAWLTYRFVEKPFRFGGNPRVNAAVLLGILIVIGGAGTYTMTSEGFPKRKPFHGIDTEIKGYDSASNYRLGLCFSSGDTGSRYADICDGSSGGKPTVVIWGDSHAASIYPGLLKQSSLQGFNLAQYNTAGCPPVFDFDVRNRKECKSLNAYVLAKLKTAKPDTVVLSAYWLLYDGKHDESGRPWDYLPEAQIDNTLSTLKSLGIRNIIVIGQLPTFNQAQIKIGLRNFTPNSNNRTYNNYIYQSNDADNRLRQIAEKNGVAFVSPIDNLCNNAGCLISTSPEKFIPLAWDYGHLTTDGSEFLIESALKNRTLKLPGR